MAVGSPERATTLPSGERVPVLGQGTWHLGQGRHAREVEIAALRRGLDHGLTVVDTAEMYGDGASELLVGEAIAGRRDEVFLVSKVLPHHATANGTIDACRASLRRLGTEQLDLYLLHWRGRVPLSETFRGFEALTRSGLIRHWGVSNFDLSDLTEIDGVTGGAPPATNQVLYNVARRGIEHDVLPWCRRSGVPVMAYSPIEQGRLLRNPVLRVIAGRHDSTPAQVALAWLLEHDGVIAIPEAGTPEHVADNSGALELRLTQRDRAALDEAFPPPAGRVPLEMR